MKENRQRLAKIILKDPFRCLSSDFNGSLRNPIAGAAEIAANISVAFVNEYPDTFVLIEWASFCGIFCIQPLYIKFLWCLNTDIFVYEKRLDV